MRSTHYRMHLIMIFLMLVTSAATGEVRPNALPDLRIARGQRGISETWLADPTTRYRHFVLGAQYEAASLVVRLANGETRKLTLPESSVFEDRQPRLADLDGDGVDEIILVHSYLDRGAALAVIGLRDGQLVIIAETPATGTARTWINPAGIADFDGDGSLDIAYVQMPHVQGLLRVWTLKHGRLVEIAQVPGVSNHVIGSSHLGMAAVADFDGDGVPDLAIPSLDRQTLRLLAFKGGVRELARHALPAPAAGDFEIRKHNGRLVVSVQVRGGVRHDIIPVGN